MPTPKLQDFLNDSGVRYRSLPHPTSYTAQRTAEVAHISGKQLAKTVVLRVDGRLAMAVLPAHDRVHLDDLRQALGAADVELASEEEMRRAFPDCDVGANPPFGNLYGMDVFVSPRLREDDEIAFNAGSHDELLVMSYRDFERLADPHPLRF